MKSLALTKDGKLNLAGSKYRAIKETVDGIKFDSRKEAEAYRKLCILRDHGKVRSFTLQPTFTFASGVKYKADFEVTWKDGRVEIIDVKGMKTPVFRLKMRLFAHEFPDRKVILW